MRAQIHKSLLLTGILSVVISFLVAGILYYQGIQARALHEIEHLTEIAADGLTGDAVRDIAFLETIRSKSEREMHITWFGADGTLLYASHPETDGGADEPEIREAIADGTGHSVRKNPNGEPMSYSAQKAADGSILRIAVPRSAPAGILTPLLPEILLFLGVFAVGCFAASQKETDYVLRPLRQLEGLISDIMEGAPERPIPGGYKELQPLVNKVREQKKEIQNYMEDLEEERNTVRTVIDTISDGILLLNDQQEVIDYNRTAKRIFRSSDDIRYRKVAVLYRDEDWLRAIGVAFGKEPSERNEYTMTLNGRPYRACMARIELADETTGLLIVLHDLTASYAAEKMRREFSANVSHELKTPLTSISGFAEMIANGMYQNEADVKLFGSRIFEESQRMMSLIETIMHLSKIEENQTTITWKPVDMGRAARYAADLIEPQAIAKHVTIHVDAEPLYVYGNSSLLSELVMNCVDNAVKYNREGGTVTVSVRPEGEDKVRLAVSDTGIGIPKEKQGRVFERFYRADESRNKSTGGSGLGLAICKHIVNQHRGTIEISSIEGEGTTIQAILPRMSDNDVEREVAAASTAQIEAAKAESAQLDPAPEAAPEEAVRPQKGKKNGSKDKKDKKDKDKKEKDKDKDKKDKKAQKDDKGKKK